MSAVEAVRGSGLKLRDALSTFRKVYSSASEKARKIPEKTDKVNWDHWRKEIRAPGVVDQLKALSEAGPEETRMTPQLISALDQARATIGAKQGLSAELLQQIQKAAAEAEKAPAAPKAALPKFSASQLVGGLFDITRAKRTHLRTLGVQLDSLRTDKPFDEVTVEEELARRPQWAQEINAEIKRSEWNE